MILLLPGKVSVVIPQNILKFLHHSLIRFNVWELVLANTLQDSSVCSVEYAVFSVESTM